MKLSEYKKDFDIFVKLFTARAAHIIIQSRLGEKSSSECRPALCKTELFNLEIPDVPEVQQKIKEVLRNDGVVTKLPLCVEISLRSADGDHMVLENWCLGLLPEHCDPTERMTSTVYSRLGTLLKALLTTTRVVPAYKVSRRQGPDSFVLCYRIHTEKVRNSVLGEGSNQRIVGQVCTPVGTVQLKVAYRTKIVASPTQSSRDNNMMLKSDHFNSAKLKARNLLNKENEDKNIFGSLKSIAPFADPIKRSEYEVVMSKEPPVCDLLEKIKKRREEQDKRIASKSTRQSCESIVEQIQETQQDEPKKVTLEDTNGNKEANEDGADMKASKITMMSTIDDFIRVDLKSAPFASNQYGRVTELAEFLEEMQVVPELETFGKRRYPSLNDLTQSLEKFESEMANFENLLQSLQCKSVESPSENEMSTEISTEISKEISREISREISEDASRDLSREISEIN